MAEGAGSIASANALLLRALLERGHEVTFFSKASFVDPRPVAGAFQNFRFVDVENRFFDHLRARSSRIPALNAITRFLDSTSYNRLLVRKMGQMHREADFDLCLWLGDYARGRVGGLPNVSFVQGAPGSDARSIIRRFAEIIRLAGVGTAWKWRLLAALRLSPLALPPFRYSDHFIVGSNVSRDALHGCFHVPRGKIHPLPYAIDLELFNPAPQPTGPIRALWLGRIIPRKRLDLFLDGAAEAIRRGLDLRLTIVGAVGFIPGYEKLVTEFPFPDRLTWHNSIPREKIPATIREHHVLIQPSEEEDFGSSMAEAQACGRPVIAGATKGTADYASPADIRLADYQPSTLADALAAFTAHPEESRLHAEATFSIDRVADKLIDILFLATK